MKTDKSPELDAAEILRSRARALARIPEPAPDPESQIEVLEFRLAKERYAIETRHVREVYPLKDLTPLPGTPPFVLGIVSLRGQILPVFDLKKFFELPEEGVTDLHCIIVVRGEDVELGLLADTVVAVRLVALENLQPSLATLTGIRSDYLKGVTEERLVVLDIACMLDDPKIIIHEEVDI